MEIDLLSDNMIDLDTLGSRLLKLNRQKYLLDASGKTKLRTFIQIYDSEHPRDIVESLLTRSQRSVMCKLKSGVLPLHIETGHWKDKPLEHRTCPICDEKLLEDVYHFIIRCKGSDDTRKELVQELVDRDIEVKMDTDVNFVKSILSKQALKVTGKFLERMYAERRELMITK